MYSVSGIDYLACLVKKSEIIEDYSANLGCTKVICDYRNDYLMFLMSSETHGMQRTIMLCPFNKFSHILLGLI